MSLKKFAVRLDGCVDEAKPVRTRPLLLLIGLTGRLKSDFGLIDMMKMCVVDKVGCVEQFQVS